MKIKVSKVMKAKTSYSSQRETVVTSSFRACSFAMDDGGRCLLDVINDPKLLQSFLESGSDENSKDPQDGTSSESAVESPQVSRSSHSTLANHLSSTEHIVDQADQMGYSYVDNQGLLAQSGVCSATGGLGGMSLIVASTSGQPTYQHASTSGSTIHHIPSLAHANLHPHSPASARSATPVSQNIKSPGQGPSSVHSMPPPSPLQQTKSPMPSHTPSPAPVWSPAPPVLSPTSRTQSSMPSVAFQQSHNQILQTSCSVTQFVTALANQQSITQKLTLQQQQQLFLQQQLSPASQQQSSPRLTNMSAHVASTTAVAVPQPLVQLIHAPSNVALPTRTSHSTVRPIQPKLPPQILPKPANNNTSNQNHFVSPSPAPKQPPPTPATTAQRTTAVGVGLQHGAPGQLVINQGQPGVFQGPQGTILLNQIIPGMGQSPILIQGNLGNLANIPGIQLTLRPPNSASPGQSINSTNPQNNATLIAALQGPSQHAQTLFTQAKSPIHGQPTIVIPNNIAHPGLTSQNINLTSAGIPNSGIISSSSQGPGFLARSNIILSPRVVGGNQSIQLQQIQTANGPIFAFAPSQTIAVPHLPTALGNAQLAPVHGVMATGQGVISGLSLQSHAPQSALQHQSLFGTAVPFTSHLEHSSPQVIQVPQPLAPQQVPANHLGHMQNQHQQQHHQQIDHSPKPASPPKPSKVPSVNLEELLKEHGIVPENSPVPSPECQSPIIEEPVPSHSIVPSPQQQIIQALQSQVLLEQGPNALSQIKLSFTQDGSLLLHQPQAPLDNSPRAQQYVSTGQINRRTFNNNTINQLILPTSSSSVPVITSSAESTPSRNHSNLIARLNSAPAISVPDVSSLALSTSVGLCTTSCITLTTSATTLVPSTVQSLSVNSSPIASSFVVQRTNNTASSPSDRLFIAEDVQTSQSYIAPVISASSAAQSVQKVTNHTNSTFQAHVVPNEHPNNSRTTMQNSPKTVQSSRAGTVATKNSQVVQFDLPKCGHREVQLVEIADNGTGAVPSHNHAAFPSNVPNHMLLRVQKEIHDLGSVKNRNPEQQKIFNQLINAQQKLMSPLQNKSKSSRANQTQLQLKIESEVEKLLLRSQTCRSAIVNNQHHQQQAVPIKAPVLITQQQSIQIEKQQNSNVKALNSHNLHLVNLLKQNQPQNAPVRHIASPTTTITTACDSTTPTVAVSTTTNQKQCNQVIPPPQPRMQMPLPQNTTKPVIEVPQVQQQVIVRLQKPVQQQQPVPICPNPVQVKVPPPVKRIVNAVPKTALIKEQLNKDQNSVINPNIERPFQSKEDACMRLLQYHVFNNNRDPTWTELKEDDRKFTERSIALVERISALKNKYRLLQLQNSMRLCVTPDQVKMERLFLEDEKASLLADRAAVAEGKILSLPPPPRSWLPKLRALCRSPSPPTVVVKQEPPSDPPDDSEGCLPLEDSDPPYKEDDNLEAPVIDSCEDIVPPPHDDNCDRSPPTLKRIVIKNNSGRCSESDSEDLMPSKKRLKFNNNVAVKSDNKCDWNRLSEVPPKFSDLSRTKLSDKSDFNDWNRTSTAKLSDKPDLSDWARTMAPKQSDNNKDLEPKANHKFPLLTRETFHSDNSRIEDMFGISPMEIGEDSRGVDINADFEPPVPRAEESNDNLLYNSGLRNNCADKYDFDLLACSDWTEEYVHNQNESDMVENMINDHPSDLDLSGLEGLDDHLDDSQHCIPNGNSADPDMNICYLMPKHNNKRFLDSSQNCSNARDQVQSAIKSIMGTPTENRNYFDADFHLPLNRHGHNSHITGYGGSASAEMGTTSSHRGEHDLDEAVRSILL